LQVSSSDFRSSALLYSDRDRFHKITDDLYARLRKQFSEEQLMQLSAQIAFENYHARWNQVFDVESDHIYHPA
jgi:hypothetical protein